MSNQQDIFEPNPDVAGSTHDLRNWRIGFILVCALWVVAISGNSLWIDEAAAAARKASQPTLRAWWVDLVRDQNADTQTPLYLLYIWGYAKFFGISEWSLRAANLPWIVVGFWAWMRALGPRLHLKWGLAAVAATSPFLWYYLNEARAYSMQAGSIFLIAAAAWQLSLRPSRLWMAAFCFGMIGLSGSNLLGAFWAGAAGVTTLFILGWDRSRQLVRTYFGLSLVTFAGLLLLGGFYLWTVINGNRATAVGTTDARNIAFIFYELFGFGGLGPGRLEIRGNGLQSFRPYFVSLAFYALLLAPVVGIGARQIFKLVPARTVLVSLVLFGGVLVFLLIVGAVSHFRLLGRHCTPLIFLVVCLLGVGLTRLWNSHWWWARAWVVIFLLASLASALSLRFAPRHGKDDYRGAAAIARQALQDGKTVWWNANERGAEYYQLPLATNGGAESGQALWLTGPTPQTLLALTPPDVVLVSRRDVFDADGALAEFLAREKFERTQELRAFTVWQRPSK